MPPSQNGALTFLKKWTVRAKEPDLDRGSIASPLGLRPPGTCAEIADAEQQIAGLVCAHHNLAAGAETLGLDLDRR